MIAISVFAGLLGLLLSMMMRRQQTREQAHERMLERERQEHHAQTLDYATQVHDSGGAVSVDRLRRLCDALREELADKGFHGGFALHDNGLMEDIDPDHMTLLGELLNEIAHNIIRHCPAGCEFDCSVMLHDDVAEVTQYNSVTHPADKK